MNNIFKKIINPLIIIIGRKIEKKQFKNIPIIIAACPRSGTTLLLSILDAYPNIHAIQRQTYAFCSWKEKIPDRLDRLYREMILHKISSNTNRWLEKTPKNIKYFEEILNYYRDDVKIIHVIRDGRDVITSMHPKHKPNQYWVSPRRWIDDVNLGLKFEEYPNVLTVKYEDIINNFNTEIEKLSEFLGENYIPDKSSWIEKTSVKKSKHWADPIQNIHSRSIGRWEKEKHQLIVEDFMNNPEAMELMSRLGYI